MSVGGQYRLYSVSLLSGEARSKGSFPRSVQVSDIAVPIGSDRRPQDTPPPMAMTRRASRTPTLAREEGVREAYAAHGAELYRFALRGLGDAAHGAGRGAGDLPARVAGA